MSGSALAVERKRLNMNGDAFGAYLAELLGRARPYNRHEVSAWETGLRPVPDRVERALLQARLSE